VFSVSLAPGFCRRSLSLLVTLGAVMSVACSELAEAPKWNVLVIVPDTIRADHLSLYGYERDTSPALVRLASESWVFERATTVAPRTWQSFSSILTGVVPPVHGVRHIFDQPIPSTMTTLATVFSSAGFRTGVFEVGQFVQQMTSARGFDAIVGAAGRREGEPVDAERRLLARLFGWMQHPGGEPFFAFVALTGGHWPYVAGQPGRFASCVGEDHAFNRGSYGIELHGVGGGVELRDANQFAHLIWQPHDEHTRQHAIAHYDAEIRFTDDLIGQLLDRMRQSPLWERTIVLITSDHGESFGEHGYLQHGPRVDEPTMHVPLLLRLPRGHPSHHASRRVDVPVSVVDIFPTLIRVSGIEAPAGLQGRDLLEAPLDDTPRFLYGETGRSFTGVDPERFYPGVRGKQRMIREGDWKLVYVPRPNGAQYRLFQIGNDPGETHDVAAARPAVVARLKAELDRVLAADPMDESPESLNDAQKAKLRELGYLE